MLIEQKKFSIRNKILIAILAVLAVAAGVYYLKNQYAPIEGLTGGSAIRDEISPAFDSEILGSEKFSKLLIRGQFPIKIDRVGNPQPVRH